MYLSAWTSVALLQEDKQGTVHEHLVELVQLFIDSLTSVSSRKTNRTSWEVVMQNIGCLFEKYEHMQQIQNERKSKWPSKNLKELTSELDQKECASD